ncbi:hypothetical protein FZW96_00375 [Bacillus sp. BGMRC 2118]|nr:hypothetical protein FZW96_00375 [Bacillus sp. BGMRC 2118]
MESFIQEITDHSEINREELFMRNFQLTKPELDSMVFFGMIDINQDHSLLRERLDNIHHLKFESFIKNKLAHLQHKYRVDKPIQLEVFLLDDNDEFVKEKLGGVSAFTEWNGRICFVVLPEEQIRHTLHSVITHEFHHHWRMNSLHINEENETLLDRMILEGLAEHFVEKELGSHFLGPYKDALIESQAKHFWRETYRYHIHEKGDGCNPFMFGNAERQLPFWGGYSIGYYLVKWYVEKNKSISIEELTILPSEQFIVD